MSALHCFVVLAVLGSALAFAGQYVPRSFYTIDENGQRSDVVYLRRDVGSRLRRSANGGGASYSGAISYDGPHVNPHDAIAATVQAGLSDTFQQLQSLASRVGEGAGHSGGGGATSFSGSFSSGGGPGVAGQGVLHSRFAEDAGGYEKELVTGGGGGVHAASSARGQNGAFSISSSSVDSNGNVRYKTSAHKF